jgi:starch phosphorylase
MTHALAVEDYADKAKWNKMSLMNIAASGFFAADRSINDYAQNIWNIRRLTDNK